MIACKFLWSVGLVVFCLWTYAKIYFYQIGFWYSRENRLIVKCVLTSFLTLFKGSSTQSLWQFAKNSSFVLYTLPLPLLYSKERKFFLKDINFLQLPNDPVFFVHYLSEIQCSWPYRSWQAPSFGRFSSSLAWSSPFQFQDSHESNFDIAERISFHKERLLDASTWDLLLWSLITSLMYELFDCFL